MTRHDEICALRARLVIPKPKPIVLSESFLFLRDWELSLIREGL